MRGEKERQREKGGNSSVVHLADDILCTPSVISFSSARMDRISSLSLSGMTASLKSLETPFSLCLSLLFSRALPLSGCYFPKTLWISYNPFFLPHLFSYFFHLELDANSTPASRPTVRLCVRLSVYLSPRPPSFSQFLSGPKAPWKKKKYKKKLKKTIYIAIFKKKKVSVLAFINERQL